MRGELPGKGRVELVVGTDLCSDLSESSSLNVKRCAPPQASPPISDIMIKIMGNLDLEVDDTSSASRSGRRDDRDRWKPNEDSREKS